MLTDAHTQGLVAGHQGMQKTHNPRNKYLLFIFSIDDERRLSRKSAGEPMEGGGDHRPSHPHNAGTEHAGFSPTWQKLLLAPSAKRREVSGESHEG